MQFHTPSRAQRLSRLQGKRDHAIAQRVDVVCRRESLEQTLAQADDVKRLLNQLQSEVQQHNMALYSELLSVLVREVFERDMSIQLVTSIVRNKAHLSLEVLEDGRRYDLIRHRGKSLLNVVVAGLRLIRVVQSDSRRFLFFDEADCWLSPDRVERFVMILSALCEQLNIQLAYISHHELSDEVKAQCTTVQLSRDDGSLIAINNSPGHRLDKTIKAPLREEVSVLHGGFGSEWFSGAGIKQIILENIQSHDNTVIPLASGLTYVRGANEIGKSAIFRALVALLTNNPDSGLIQDGQQEAQVTIVVENDVRIVWVFLTEKGPSQYDVFQGNKQIGHHVCKAGEVPDLVRRIVNLPGESVGNAHFVEQADPLYILSPQIKPYDRAAFLSIDEEFVHISQMKVAYQQQLKVLKNDISVCEQQLQGFEQTCRQLQSLDVLEAFEQQWQQYQQQAQFNMLVDIDSEQRTEDEDVLSCLSQYQNTVAQSLRGMNHPVLTWTRLTHYNHDKESLETIRNYLACDRQESTAVQVILDRFQDNEHSDSPLCQDSCRLSFSYC